ncbi:F-type conjugative transfer protein TrbC [Candidatus Pantoea floridensis]|uniref:Intracellular multiplication protein IcmO n=1 Tax=Candidatus Pantoea floridensis TaxID=1938870 RepID=A0A286DSF0_9GAMM|nr:F-type conjugative transfer protein TrbC [Pantoea floridensis]PIF06929.1 intracellular multiplication protein IcmO [Enterobacteriaceae bacterium JKS000233]SOD61543.1 intracellular multiplication protein IcmO [Pantoea floridensis]
MSDNNSTLDNARVNRHVGRSWLTDMLSEGGSLFWAMPAAVVAGLIWPATLLLSLPVLLFWSMVVAPAGRWKMPMRMPTDMNRDDPSTERQVPARVLGFLPVASIRIHTGRAAGILYAGYLRGKDAGRELWLSMDDLTRHVLMFGTTGAGKTETLMGWVFNALCWGKGLIISDHKAQNDVALSVMSMARRFGREDDLRVMNFITGGTSRAQQLLDNAKGRPQTNTTSVFGLAQETYTVNLMDSMLPKTGSSGGEWQEKAKAMNQALIFALVYKCRREGTTLSQRTIQQHLPLRKIAGLYIQAVEEQWHEEIRHVLQNYLDTLSGFDIDKVATPSEWDPEANRQHGYLMQQFTRMLSLFSDTYGHVFARDAGDIDLRDVVHNDRILIVLVPALELSSSESSTLGRLYQSQLAMILSQDLGEKIEGRPQENMKVRRYRDRFPFLWIIDEVGAGYSEKLGELATQIRSLGYCLLLAGQEVQRLKTAAGDAVWTLIANMGTRITGSIRDPKDTLEILQLMAGTEYRAHMGSMVQQGGILGGWNDDTRLQVSEKKKVDVDEIKALQEGESITLFRGEVIRGSSLYIKDADKFSQDAVRINRFVEVSPPSEQQLLATMPFRERRSYVRADRVQHILRVLDAAPGPQDTRRLVMTDPALATVCEFDLECKYSWKRSPAAAVRAAVLWNMVLASLPAQGRGYKVRLREPRLMGVAREAIEKAEQNYVPLAHENVREFR